MNRLDFATWNSLLFLSSKRFQFFNESIFSDWLVSRVFYIIYNIYEDNVFFTEPSGRLNAFRGVNQSEVKCKEISSSGHKMSQSAHTLRALRKERGCLIASGTRSAIGDFNNNQTISVFSLVKLCIYYNTVKWHKPGHNNNIVHLYANLYMVTCITTIFC